MTANVRALAAKCTFAVVDKGRSLMEELPRLQENVEGKDKGLLQEICYGVLRHLPELEHDVRQYVKKPLTGKQRVAHFLALVGVYQLKYTRIPDHAALSETVAATKAIRCLHLKGMINAILRNVQRAQKENAEPSELPDAIKYNHPSWFIKKLQAAYPEKWQQVLAANQERPPMWVRVNSIHHTVEQYLALLKEANIEFSHVEPEAGAILLTNAIDVNLLPGFDKGWASIQDAAAQQAARLLDAQAGDNVLDCCAAPGGKTCHILEHTPDVGAVTAIDIEEKRLTRVHENLARLNLKAKVIAADAAKPDAWWDGEKFDRILLDAPCSATGVIRRHPDIKWLRKADDIEALAKLQQQILQSMWQLLKPGGTLVYATCSVLPDENDQQVKAFVDQTSDAQLIPIKENDIGWQILPDEQAMDGFYYAKLVKNT